MGISSALIRNKEAYETNWKDGSAVLIFKKENNWFSQGQERTYDGYISFPARVFSSSRISIYMLTAEDGGKKNNIWLQ